MRVVVIVAALAMSTAGQASAAGLTWTGAATGPLDIAPFSTRCRPATPATTTFPG
jgi:hypothetical protein